MTREDELDDRERTTYQDQDNDKIDPEESSDGPCDNQPTPSDDAPGGDSYTDP